MNASLDSGNRALGARLGIAIGDALSMPVHWYYNRLKLHRDYGHVTDLMPPLAEHPDSIFWRSHWEAPRPELDILGDQRVYWGQQGVHYHQALALGENTLSGKLASELWDSLEACGGYDPTDFGQRYVDLLTHPERHRDTYVEECHRGFFTNLGKGIPLDQCGIEEKHISGLAMALPAVCYHQDDEDEGRKAMIARLSLTHPGLRMKQAADAILSILQPVLAGNPLKEVILKECQQQRNQHFGFPFRKWLQKEDAHVIGREVSSACYVEDAVPAIVYLALKYHDDPERALIANTNLGGDNVHRGSVLGALLGAAHGADAWPSRWSDNLISAPFAC